MIMAISVISCTWQAWLWLLDSFVPLPRMVDLHLGPGWMNLVAATFLLTAFVYAMKRWKPLLTGPETTWLYGSNEVLSAFISLAFLTGVGLIWTDGIWLLGIFPMLFHLFRGKGENLPVTEGFGLAHVLLPVVPVFISALMVDSLYFSEQLPIGKVARVELFFSLYLIAELYRRYHPKSRFGWISRILGQIFFAIIPVVFLPAVWHHQTDYFPAVLWLSCGICLGLLWGGKTHALLLELRVLVGLAGIGAIAACALVQFFGWQGHGFLALAAGLVFYGPIVLFWKGLRENPAGSQNFMAMRARLSPFFSQAFYYLGIFIFVLSYGYSGSAVLALTLWTVYFGMLSLMQPGVVPLKGAGSRIYVIAGGVCGRCYPCPPSCFQRPPYLALRGIGHGLSGTLRRAGSFDPAAFRKDPGQLRRPAHAIETIPHPHRPDLSWRAEPVVEYRIWPGPVRGLGGSCHHCIVSDVKKTLCGLSLICRGPLWHCGC